MRTNRIPLVLCGLLVVSACGAGDGGEPAGDSPGPVVETSLGTLEGEHVTGDDGVLVFRGVPYAEAPVGDSRWRAPVAKASWEGTRSATTFGPACWQRLTPESSIYTRGDLDRDEDCLYLNVWTAAADATESRPVMVWFHGGGHTGGWGSAKIFDGTALANKGVVLVTINYRLGPFGFLAHPALTGESPHASSGNYGLLDKVAALEWVRDNIAAFGGDPGNVTIFGQSAGSWSVCYLMASPLAAGLFHKAIGHSGGCFRGGRPDLAAAHEAGLAAAAEVGVEGDDAEALTALRALDAEAVLDSDLGSGAIVDGWFMPQPAPAIFEAGEHNDVPVIVGALANEGTTLYASMPERTETELVSMLREQYGEHADALLAAYEPEVQESTKWGAQAIQADRSFRLGDARLGPCGGGGRCRRVSLLLQPGAAGIPDLRARTRRHRDAGRARGIRRVPFRRPGLCVRQHAARGDRLDGLGSRDLVCDDPVLGELRAHGGSERRRAGDLAALRDGNGRVAGVRIRHQGLARGAQGEARSVRSRECATGVIAA